MLESLAEGHVVNQIEVKDDVKHWGARRAQPPAGDSVVDVGLRRLIPHLAAQFLQLIKTGSAPPDVRQYGGDLTILRLLREFQQDFCSRTIDALRIGEAFMDNPFKRIYEFFFRIHSARPS